MAALHLHLNALTISHTVAGMLITVYVNIGAFRHYMS